MRRRTGCLRRIDGSRKGTLISRILLLREFLPISAVWVVMELELSCRLRGRWFVGNELDDCDGLERNVLSIRQQNKIRV